jgi:hypothetical protein
MTSDAASSVDGNRQRDSPDQQMPIADDFLTPTTNHPTVPTNIPLRHCPREPAHIATGGLRLASAVQTHPVNRRLRSQPRTLHRQNFIGESLPIV